MFPPKGKPPVKKAKKKAKGKQSMPSAMAAIGNQMMKGC